MNELLLQTFLLQLSHYYLLEQNVPQKCKVLKVYSPPCCYWERAETLRDRASEWEFTIERESGTSVPPFLSFPFPTIR
jgi:hypothetical protein